MHKFTLDLKLLDLDVHFLSSYLPQIAVGLEGINQIMSLFHELKELQ